MTSGIPGNFSEFGDHQHSLFAPFEALSGTEKDSYLSRARAISWYRGIRDDQVLQDIFVEAVEVYCHAKRRGVVQAKRDRAYFSGAVARIALRARQHQFRYACRTERLSDFEVSRQIEMESSLRRGCSVDTALLYKSAYQVLEEYPAWVWDLIRIRKNERSSVSAIATEYGLKPSEVRKIMARFKARLRQLGLMD